jgi:hypothetical protein
LEDYHRAVGILQTLLAAEPDSASNGDALATTYAGVGGILRKTANLNGAQLLMRQAVSLAESASKKSPDSKKYQSHLAQRYYDLGAIDAQIAKSMHSSSDAKDGLVEARQFFQRSLDVWQDLRAKGKLSGIDAHKPDEVARAIMASDLVLGR